MASRDFRALEVAMPVSALCKRGCGRQRGLGEMSQGVLLVARSKLPVPNHPPWADVEPAQLWLRRVESIRAGTSGLKA